jgi:hypothetical protein
MIAFSGNIVKALIIQGKDSPLLTSELCAIGPLCHHQVLDDTDTSAFGPSWENRQQQPG